MGPRSFSRNYFDKNTTPNDFEAQSLSEMTPQATKIQVNVNTKIEPKTDRRCSKIKISRNFTFCFGCHLLCSTK